MSTTNDEPVNYARNLRNKSEVVFFRAGTVGALEFVASHREELGQWVFWTLPPGLPETYPVLLIGEDLPTFHSRTGRWSVQDSVRTIN